MTVVSMGGNPSRYVVERVTSKMANDLTIRRHYLRRRASTMFAWGLFDGMELLGVVIYGKPASPFPCIGVCGAEESSRVLELTRLWIDDSAERNSESFLIGSSLRQLPEDYDIVLSYAEIEAGHLGVVYQATNWIYTGLSSAHKDWAIEGETVAHSRHRLDELGGVNKARALLGDNLVQYERGRKHRYVMFRGSKTRRKELLGKLRYAPQDYPKIPAHLTQLED